MNFLVDAHLPRRAAEWFRSQGHNAIHTFDLPHRNKTSDPDIITAAEAEQRVVITKDADFVDSHLLRDLFSGLKVS